MASAIVTPDHCALHAPSNERTDTAMTTSPMQPPLHTYPLPDQRIFQVRITTHTGGLCFWFNQSRTVSGTYAVCAAAVRNAQTHNLILGWWSLLSILFMNWIAIAENASAGKSLDRDFQAYAQWWQQYCAPRHPTAGASMGPAAHPVSQDFGAGHATRTTRQ